MTSLDSKRSAFFLFPAAFHRPIWRCFFLVTSECLDHMQYMVGTTFDPRETTKTTMNVEHKET